MGDVGNLINFAYSWIREEKWRKYFFLFAGIFVIFAIVILLLLFDILTLLVEIVTSPIGLIGFRFGEIIDRFIKALPLLIIVFLSMMIIGGWAEFVIAGKALREKKYPAKIFEFNFNSFSAYFSVAAVAFFTILFNWLSMPILIMQVVAWIFVTMVHVEPFAWYALIVFGPILIICIIYTAIRLALAGPIRIVEQNDAISAIKQSWACTKGEIWEIIGLTWVAGLPASFVLSYGDTVLRPVAEAFLFLGRLGIAFTILLYGIVFVVGFAASSLAGALGIAYIYHIIKRTEAGKYTKLEI